MEEEFTDFEWTDPQGSNHLFATYLDQPDLQAPCTGPTSPTYTSGYALDGSGYYMSIVYDVQNDDVDIVVYDKNRNEIYPALQDPNGNSYSEDGNENLVDTMGRTPVQRSINGNQVYYDVLTYGGGSSRYTVTREQVNYYTNFLQSGVHDESGSFTAIQSIQLPDGSTYSFTYDSGTSPGHYGELLSVTLPSGGVIQFGYQEFEDAYSNDNMWLSSLQKDGGTTTFTLQPDSYCSQTAGCEESTTVTTPDQNASLYTFSLDPEEYPNATSRLTKLDVYEGAIGQQELEGVTTDYTDSTYQFTQPDGLQVTYLLHQVETDQTSLSPPSGSETAQTVTTLDSNGTNPTDVKEWDYYSGTPPSSPTLETEYTYGQTFNGAALPTEIKTVDGSGSEVNDTQIGYDGNANVTSVNKWINTDGTYFTTSATINCSLGRRRTCRSANGTFP